MKTQKDVITKPNFCVQNATFKNPQKFRSFSQLDDPERIMTQGFVVKLKQRKQPSRLDSRIEEWKSNLHKHAQPQIASATELKSSISQDKAILKTPSLHINSKLLGLRNANVTTMQDFASSCEQEVHTIQKGLSRASGMINIQLKISGQDGQRIKHFVKRKPFS